MRWLSSEARAYRNHRVFTGKLFWNPPVVSIRSCLATQPPALCSRRASSTAGGRRSTLGIVNPKENKSREDLNPRCLALVRRASAFTDAKVGCGASPRVSRDGETADRLLFAMRRKVGAILPGTITIPLLSQASDPVCPLCGLVSKRQGIRKVL